MTSGQIVKYIRTAEEQRSTVESVQRAYESGIIAAALNPAADFSSMTTIIKLLGLDLKYQGVFNRVSTETNRHSYRFHATSDGRTGQDFVEFWEKKFRLTHPAKDVARHALTFPSVGVTYPMQILSGIDFLDGDRHTQKIFDEAHRRGYRTLPTEAAFLLRDAIFDDTLKQLGLHRLIGMHESLQDSSGRPCFLGISRQAEGSCVIACDKDRNCVPWPPTDGFVFLAP